MHRMHVPPSSPGTPQVLPTQPCSGVEMFDAPACGPGDAALDHAWALLTGPEKATKGVGVNGNHRRTQHQARARGRFAAADGWVCTPRTFPMGHRTSPAPRPTPAQLHIHVADVQSSLLSALNGLKAGAGWTTISCSAGPAQNCKGKLAWARWRWARAR